MDDPKARALICRRPYSDDRHANRCPSGRRVVVLSPSDRTVRNPGCHVRSRQPARHRSMDPLCTGLHRLHRPTGSGYTGLRDQARHDSGSAGTRRPLSKQIRQRNAERVDVRPLPGRGPAARAHLRGGLRTPSPGRRAGTRDADVRGDLRPLEAGEDRLAVVPDEDDAGGQVCDARPVRPPRPRRAAPAGREPRSARRPAAPASPTKRPTSASRSTARPDRRP